MKIKDSCLSRRRFLGSMIAGGAAALAGGAAYPLMSYTGNLHEEPPPDFLVLEPADYEVQPGTAKILFYGHIPALLLRTAEQPDDLKIFVATCTHLDCTVSFRPDKGCIFCACHEGKFDYQGRVIAGPPPAPLRRFYQRRMDEKLVIALGEENLEKAFSQA